MIETSGIRHAVVRWKSGMRSRARWSWSVVGFFAVSFLAGLLLATPLGGQVPSGYVVDVAGVLRMTGGTAIGGATVTALTLGTPQQKRTAVTGFPGQFELS